jgi:uncharacterized membrane protein YdbT with pleckstrin-like domain
VVDVSGDDGLPDEGWVRSSIGGGERVLRVAHPHVVGSVPGYLLGLAGFAVAAHTWPVTGLRLLGTLATVLTSLSLVVGTHLRRVNTWYVVTDEQVVVKRGVVSTSTNPIDLPSILEMEVRRPVYLRPLGVGHLRLLSASTDSVDVSLSFAPGLGEWVSSIKSRRREAR